MSFAVELKNISKNYFMGDVTVQALKDVSFSINAGEFACLSGPSGSGKSTLLNIIGLIDLPTSGQVLLNGKNIYDSVELKDGLKLKGKLDAELTDLRREELGFIFQNFNLVPVLNVEENINLPLKLGESRVVREMSASQKKEWVDFLIETVGLTQWKKHKPSELSGGQRQRVAVARALVTKAGIILADEPTANLDQKNGDQILELMKKLNEELGTTFIFSTHDAKIVNMCNHVIRIMDGSVVQS